MSKSFIRTDSFRFLRLGKKKKSLRVWRRAKGKHSKMRRRRAGYPAIPNIGYRNARVTQGLIKGMTPTLIHNILELSRASKNSIIIISRTVGAKKKIEIMKKAREMNMKILNVKQNDGDSK